MPIEREPVARIIAAEIRVGGLAIAFDNGDMGFYTNELLHSILDRAIAPPVLKDGKVILPRLDD